MGRTLVIPPSQRMYLLQHGKGQQKTDFGFADFFPIKEMSEENDGLDIITMKEFLETEAMQGRMKDIDSGKVAFPPKNQTEWDGEDVKTLREWLRTVTDTPRWNPDNCLAVFPAAGKHDLDADIFRDMPNRILKQSPKVTEFLDDPAPVDSTPFERMRENIGSRKNICLYDKAMQGEEYVHLMSAHKYKMRLLTHFYTFLFFEDWREVRHLCGNDFFLLSVV